MYLYFVKSFKNQTQEREAERQTAVQSTNTNNNVPRCFNNRSCNTRCSFGASPRTNTRRLVLAIHPLQYTKKHENNFTQNSNRNENARQKTKHKHKTIHYYY
jgi:hypothetical protein